jgi:hypothetical protein
VDDIFTVEISPQGGFFQARGHIGEWAPVSAFARDGVETAGTRLRAPKKYGVAGVHGFGSAGASGGALGRTSDGFDSDDEDSAGTGQSERRALGYVPGMFPRGTRVQALWKDVKETCKHYFDATVVGVYGDGTYELQYDDGDHDERVPASDVRIHSADPAAATITFGASSAAAAFVTPVTPSAAAPASRPRKDALGRKVVNGKKSPVKTKPKGLPVALPGDFKNVETSAAQATDAATEPVAEAVTKEAATVVAEAKAAAAGTEAKAERPPKPPPVPWTKVRGEGYNATGPFVVHGRLALDGTGRLELKFAYTRDATFRRGSATKQESVVSAHLLLGPASEGYQGAEYGWPIVELPPLPQKTQYSSAVAEAKSTTLSANPQGESILKTLQIYRYAVFLTATLTRKHFCVSCRSSLCRRFCSCR